MSKNTQFGETVEGYSIPVLNEREIRAAAGILFVMMFVSITRAGLMQDFTLLKHAVMLFLADITVRVFVNPRYAPFLILGRLIVRNQVPEYVGAPQKRFAWSIGFGLAVIMLVHLVLLNAFSPITGIICMICLVFLFFETAFGICLGCKVYPLFFKDRVQYCPGEVCAVNERHAIQKTSRAQWLVLSAFAVCALIGGLLLNESFQRKPYDIFGIEKAMQQR